MFLPPIHKFVFFLLTITLMWVVPCLGDQPAANQVRVVMDDNYPPYVFRDEQGRLKGILVDQWRLWEKKTGLRADLQAMDWAEAQRRMESGEFDVIDTIFRNERRERIYDFTRPYAVIPVPLFFDADLSGIRGAADLKGFVVAAKAGGNVLDILRKNGVTSIAEYPSYEKIIEAARDGKVKVFTVDRPPAIYYLHKMGIHNRFRETAPMYSGEFHRAVLKGNLQLLKTIESGFSRITPEEYRAIDKAWMGTPLPNSPFIRYAGYLAVAGASIVLILMISLRILKKAIARKTSELAASEQRYRSLVDNLPLGISLIDANHRNIMVNSTLARMFGHEQDWFTGRLCHEKFEKQQQICAHCPRNDSVTIDGISQVDIEENHEDGSNSSFRIYSVPLRDAQASSAGFIEVVEDITERQQARQDLENERVRLRTLLQTIPDLVWLKDPQGVYLACNVRFERFFGTKEEQIIGKTDYDFVEADLADFFREHDLKAIAAGGPSINEEWVTFADDGHRELLETIKTPTRDADGKLIGVLGIARDITAMRKVEESLRLSEARLKDAQHIASIGNWEYDPVSGQAWWSDEVFHIFEIDPQVTQASYEAFLAIVHPDDRDSVEQSYHQALEQHTPYNLDHRLLMSDGRIKFIHAHCETTYDDNGRPLRSIGTVQDITERKQADAERDKTQRLESLGILAGGIAHDFNNILAAILGNVSFARKYMSEEHRAAQRLAECEKAIMRAGELTQQLLTFARGGEPLRQTVNTLQIIEESVSLCLRGAAVKGVVMCPPDIWWLQADPGQISQVLNNLIINAKQAMPEGGVVTVKVENHVRGGDGLQIAPGRYVRVTVADQGTGISAENLPRIFDPYFSTKSTGSGLGLASVYSIMQRHGGLVTVDSKPGEGSIFTLLIPAAKEGVVEAKENVADMSQLQGNGRILIMDDDAMIREMAVELLSDLGYTVDACADGHQAVSAHAAALQKGEPYRAIILDLTVPGGMGGQAAAALLREKDRDVPLIVSSGYSNDAVVAEYRAYGFSGVVLKPYSMQGMATSLAQILIMGIMGIMGVMGVM